MNWMAWAGITVLTAYLVFVGGGWWGIYSAPLRLLSVTLAAAALATWAFVAMRDERWRPRSVLLPAILGCLASLAISTAFSRAPRVSAEYLGYSIVLAALYLLMVQLFRSVYFGRRLVLLAGLLFAVAATAYLGGVARQWMDWWGLVGHFAIPPLRPGFEGLTYGNPSAALTVIALLAIPASAAVALPSRRGLLALLAIGTTVAAVALASGSRSGWLALSVSALAVTLVWLFGTAGLRRAATSLGGLRPPVKVLLAVVGVAAIVVAIAFAPSILLRAGSGGEDLRWSYAMAATRLFASSPIVGTGPGTWVIERIRQTTAPDVDSYVPHAHDVPIQTLGELGILGALAGLALLAVLAWLVRDGMADADRARRAWGWLTFAGLLYFGLHQLLDFYPNLPAALFAAAVPVAYLDASATRRPLGARLQDSLGWPSSLAAAVVVAVACAGVAVQEIAALQFQRAVAAADAGDWDAALEPSRAALAADPAIGSYQLVAGLAESRAGNAAVAANLFTEVARTSDLPEAWLNLASEQLRLGDPSAAIVSVQSSLRLGYQRPAIAMPAGELALRLGDSSLAVDAFASAITVAPSLAGDPWWQGDGTRATALRTSLTRVVDGMPQDQRWELLLMAGDSEGAATAADGNTFAGDVVAAWARDAAALWRMFDRCDAQPLDFSLQLWCARLASRNDDPERANRHLALAIIVATDVPGLGKELRVATTPGGASGSPADFWGTYTYRRPTPVDILVPELVHLVGS